MTYKEIYHDCLMQEEYRLAYKIIHLQKRGLITLEDQYNLDDFGLIDGELLFQEYKENAMGFFKHYAYAFPIGEVLHFVIASNETNARMYATNIMKLTYEKCHEFDLDTSVYTNNSFTTFRELKNNELTTPVFVGIYDEKDIKN